MYVLISAITETIIAGFHTFDLLVNWVDTKGTGNMDDYRYIYWNV